MHQLNKIAKWDKLKTWHALKQDIDERLHAQDVSESITIEIGPQLLYTLHHQSALRCIDQTSTIHGEMFTCHYNKGAVHGIRIWNIDYQEHQGVCKHIGFEINSEITCMTYVSRHRAYMFFCSDLTLRAFTDSYSNFEQVGLVPCLSTILCLVYNKDSDEIYAGGIGFIEQWTVMGAEHAVTLVPGRKFHTTLTRNDWIRDIKIVKQDHLMIAQHGNGLCVINLKSGMQLRRLANRHDGPLTCCCYYAASDFLFTGGSDGRIKVFNGTACNLLHTFVAHHGLVTVVEPHRKENLLFSTSHDGTLKVWKLDNLQIVQFMRLDLGEMIFRFSLLRDTEFYLQTEKEIQIYDLNQFYQLFAAVESQTRRLMCCQGKGSPNRILASTQDGSVRLLSPITGLTLTIIYPMPSFQALTSFAYDLHQERLHTVLSSGKVLVYSTTTNPCKAEEIWEAKCQDEKVNIILLVHMEFEIDGETDCDNLVFAGLENGQIILCDAVVCTLDNRVQAHEGAVVCLENASSHLGGARSLVISGGKDNFVKIWLVGLEVEASRPVVSLVMIIKIYLPARPMHMCMYSNLLWITLRQPSKSGPKWPLIMYKMAQIHCRKNSLYERVPAKFLSKAFMPFQITHSEDEDHVQQVTALDKCSWMKLVVTSGKDGYVKIWSCENLLVREINFASPIYAVCFANIQGDLLVGFGTHICSVSVLTYLPVAHLKKIEAARINFEDEIREKPVKFDYKSEPWLHLDNVRHLSLDIVERRRQHLELEVIDLLKKSTGKNEETKFVIFNDAGTTKVIRKDFADRLLDLSKGIQKLKLNKKIAIFQPFKGPGDARKMTQSIMDKRTEAKLQIKAAKADDKSKDADQIRTIKEEETDYSDTKGLVEIYPSSVGTAFRDLRSQRGRGQETMRLLKEQELLNKDPIIAPDGYIPNSVIRKKLKKRDVPLKQEKPFKLKPVPRVNPQHMPPWWDNQTEEDMEETATSVPLEYRVMKWDDTPSPTPRSVISSVSSVSLESLVESPVKKYIAEGRSKTISPKSPKSKSEQKITSKPKSRNEMMPVDNVKLMVAANNKNLKAKKSGWDDDNPPSEDDTEMSAMQRRYSNQQRTLSVDLESDISPKPSMLGYKGFGKMMNFVQKDLEAYSPESLRRRRLGERTDTQEKSMKLTDYAVDEDSSAIHVIKDTKRPAVKCLTNLMHHAIIRQLLEEEWFPKMKADFEYKDVLRNLLSVLDVNKSAIFGSACNYITSLYRELGLSDEQLKMIIGELAVYLKSKDPHIRKHVIRTLQTLGEGRTDVLIMVLKLLVDEEESVREAAADCIRVLTGATDKETLLNILEALGITEGFYNSKADEAYTLALLAERFAQHQDPEHFNRIKNWIQGTTPGIYDDKEDDSLQDGMRSGKEHSFMSEGKSVIDLCDTSGRNTMYADLPTTPGSFSDTDELIFSRGVSMLDAKSGGMKSEKSRYNARLDLLERAGASVIPSDRWQQPTPLSDIMGNDAFMMEDSQTPFMEDPLLNFPNESFMSLDEAPVLTREKSDVSVTRHSSTKSLKDLLLKERTLTDLSQVGPLPNFLPRDNSGRNFDDVSTDSAFESAVSVSEYANSHFSEKGTTDQYSSKHSQMSEENNMFDVEQVSHLEYEGEDAESGIDVHDINKHVFDFDKSMKEALAYKIDKLLLSDHNGLEISEPGDLELTERNNSMHSEKCEEIESGKISVIITPRGSSNITPRGPSILDRESTTSKKVGALTPRSKKDGALTPRSKKDGALTPGSKKDGALIPGSKKDGALIPGSKKDGVLTPGSKATESTLKNKMKDMDGFSTISDRSSSSRKSRMSGSSNSEFPSRSSTGPGIPLPYTLPSQLHDSSSSRTPSSRSGVKAYQKMSPRVRDSITPTPITELHDANGQQFSSKLGISKQPTTIIEQDSPKPLEVRANEGEGENSMDFVETVALLNITPVNSPEALHTATEPVTETKEPITERTSFLVTPGTVEAAVTMETEASAVSMETEDQREFESPSRHVEDTQPAAPGIAAPLDIRFTPKDHHLYQYYDSQLGTPPGPVPPSLSKLKESENVREAVPDKDSGYSGQTISDIPSSQVTGSSLSTQELGVSRDISEFSHGKLGVSRDMSEVSHGKLGVSGEFSHGKLGVSRDLSEFSHGKPFGKGYPRAALSPVKSELASPPPKSGPHTPKDWRRFFELVPNAQERKQMELIRREMEAGKLKHHTLPPISYFAEDLPMLPGEAGTRLLQTVRVGEKMQAPGDGRHRIESVPGKLAVHTQNEDAGLSNFGILQMQWTTGVPSVRDRLHPPQRIAQHRNQAMIQEESLLNSANSYNRLRHGLSEEELNLPYIDTASPSMTKRQSADQYEWEYPLPPPPAKESRTQVPMIRRDHENYCKYYHLLKKKLHLYTSKQKERSQHLPEVFVKRLQEQGQGQDEKSAAKPRKQTSLTKIDTSLLFPPIKLGQLVKIC